MLELVRRERDSRGAGHEPKRLARPGSFRYIGRNIRTARWRVARAMRALRDTMAT
jgi:hypothetical protein